MTPSIRSPSFATTLLALSLSTLFVGACGSDGGSDNPDDKGDSDGTEGTEEADDTDDTDDTGDTGDAAAPPIRPFCRLLTLVSEYDGTETQNYSQSWDGNTATAPGYTANYNEYGMVVSSEEVEASYAIRRNLEWACDGWCKLLSVVQEEGDSLDDLTRSTEVTYDWDGNTQTQGDPETRFWIYNDMGYVTRFYDEGDGYSQDATTTYDCDAVWCRKLTYEAIWETSAGTTVERTTYEWSGNEVTWDGGSATYNDYGYPLVERTVYSGGEEQVTTRTYDACD